MAKRLTEAERRAEVETLLGPELVAQYQKSIDFGVKLRLAPAFIEKAVRRREWEAALVALGESN